MLPSGLDSFVLATAIGCAAIGGVYLAFSAVIMTALGSLDRPAGIEAMQAVNAVILRSPFMPLFFGTTLASGVLAAIAVATWSAPGSGWLLAASLLHLVGMFGVTAAFNVPLNHALAAVSATAPEAGAVWARYLGTWTAWNHLRTVASLAAAALYGLALARGP
jgi:uncharacterized membrane protein